MFSRAFWVSCLLGLLCALAHSKDVESNLEQSGGGNLMLVEESKLEEKKITRRASEDKIESTNNESVELIKKKISEEKKPSKRALNAPRVPIYGGVYGNHLGYNNDYFPPYSNNVGYGGVYANPYANYANYAGYGYGASYGGAYGGQNVPAGYYGAAAYGPNRGPKSPLVYGGIPINSAMSSGPYGGTYDQANAGPARNDDAYPVNNAGYGGHNAGYAVSYNGVNSGVQGLYSGSYFGGYGQTIPQYSNGAARSIGGDYGDAYGVIQNGGQVGNYNLGHNGGIGDGQGLTHDVSSYGVGYGDGHNTGEDQIGATTGHSGLVNEAPLGHTTSPAVSGNHGGSEVGLQHLGNTEGYGPSGSYKNPHNLGGDKEKGIHNGGELLSKGAYLNARGKGLMDKFLSSFILRVPVPVEVPKYYPVHIPKPFPVKVIKPVPYPVYKNIPYPVQVPTSQQGPYGGQNNPHVHPHNIYGGQGGNVGK